MSLVNFTEITVKSTARLHMGFFDLHGGLGRKFGSIGLSLATPGIELSAMRSEKLSVSGFASLRAEKIARQLISKLNLTSAVNLDIKQTIPEHAGMGSGTQFALTIGTAISRLYGLNLNTAQIAELTGRGGRSGIGIAAFDCGGLLIDGGRVSPVPSSLASKMQLNSVNMTALKAPPLIARYDFPEDWRILLILDNHQPGIHGEEELAAFKTLPIFPENIAAHLCRSVLMQAMPAMVEKDLTAFGYSIRELQMHVGDYFAPAQGGRYASKYVGAVLQHLEALGVACYGQSSWGPTGFAVFESEELAQKYMLQLKMKFTEPNLIWQICSANNNGSKVLTA
ncbi:MAG: GHMP kinase [Methylotenera sp.]|uniref:beta-ribofuranosylaminobenzene 5'-phosphate synthase family protein n=1 Tax=Methylotenera sp. TaxID=2051956 RepID=UPI002487441E|nr:beta-ribofuranosylaminobenzene 5'-phosphate synthase family protein [Methylotenera sp.]MDI1309598.1 GHMP kinase [Methylotenera sp.]